MPVLSKLFSQRCQLQSNIFLHESHSNRYDLPSTSCPHCLPWQVADRCESLQYLFEAHGGKATDLGRGPKKTRASHQWIVDSGATVNCINDLSFFECIYQDHPTVKIVVANGKTVSATAVGAVRLYLTDDRGRIHDFLLHNVVYSEHFSHNLLSVREMWKQHSLECTFGSRNYFRSTKGDRYSFSYDREYAIPQSRSALSVSVKRGYATNTVSQALDPEIIHARFGHIGAQRLQKTPRRSTGFPAHDHLDHDPADCDACNAGGAKRKPFPRRSAIRFPGSEEKN